ncbi:MAG: LysO family transporter [Candidatus Bathyarchaeia archaeon]
MVSFAVLVLPLIAGLFSGYLLREKRKVSLAKATLGIILILIFSLGFTIGSNNELLGSMSSVGLSALLMALLAIGFSVLFVALIRKRVRI